jgi:TFIIF-interacting CTD phosphatase-like protein
MNKDLADNSINFIDKKKAISKRIYKTALSVGNNEKKDVKSLLNLNEKKTLIIDSNPENHLSLNENVIHINKWCGESSDNSLNTMMNMIRKLKNSDDVREELKR